ncbi:MAG: hypothetical protein QF560_12440 [SAR324 cluster bacterium]|nr:hypothetical protein [SAR324 cluster bacterium]MEE1574694.1 hypothetical protein [Deltaproteobacteria bacterium]MDP6246135.1 hypothetical protein [SAR324 cluster bacterium]MDP6462411.1 hypothetical protein [SAR324 cluster bacterium]MDP6638923.1 hypothetical protein [SAR324 cluster bacterium]
MTINDWDFMTLMAWVLAGVFLIVWVGFNYYFGPRLGLPDWF